MEGPSSWRTLGHQHRFQPVIIESLAPIEHQFIPRCPERSKLEQRKKPVLSPYLHLPMAKAAFELNMSVFELSREYRSQGLESWPGREIRAMNREIKELEESLATANLWKYIANKTRIKGLQENKSKIYEKVRAGHAGRGLAIDDMTRQFP